jgi:peptidoglycan-N-acetylglucosamine deacetylase
VNLGAAPRERQRIDPSDIISRVRQQRLLRSLIKRSVIDAATRWPLRRFIAWRARDRGRREVAITFDDGPHPDYTPGVLRELAHSGVQATFFVLGRQVERHPGLFQRIREAGHEVGNHGYDHSLVNLAGQIEKTRAIIAQLGSHARTLRPPYGRLSATTLAWAASRGMPVCLWSFDVDDSRRHEGKVAERRPFDEIRPGDMILMHDDNPICVAELPALLEFLRRSALHPTRVSSLLGYEVP